MAVLAGAALFFSAEEGAAESKVWSEEMDEINMATR